MMLGMLAFVLLTFPLSARAFTAIVAFGDSYTDTGNAPSSPPDYWNGRFSNGPLWIEDLSQILGFGYNPANNYAVSGTESDELGVAVANFPGTSDSANVLFSIWTGNNDIANHLNLGGNDAAWDTRINGIVSSLMTASDLLYQKGARNLVLFNVMDLTRCPDVLSAYSASFRSYISGKIQNLNSRLAAALPNLLSSHPGLQVYLVDTWSDFNYLVDNYTSLGFTTATVGALNDHSLFDRSFSGPGADYVFWDSQHPTAKTHSLVAQWVAAVLPPPPPTVSITAPQDGAQFTAPANIPINAAVVPNGWNITQLAFFENDALVGQVSGSPYLFTLSSAAAGTYNLTAQVTYGSGQTATSTPIQVTVSPAAAPPVLNITHTSGGTIELTITGTPGATCVCEASTDLVNWFPISTNLSSSGIFQIHPSQTGTGGQSFYRAFIAR
jgi:phospholipase/lecithinase/hemolysin